MGKWVERETSFETDVKRFAHVLKEKGTSYMHLFRLGMKEGE
jgi:hypothetical protein